jgi:HNH endonuclease
LVFVPIWIFGDFCEAVLAMVFSFGMMAGQGALERSTCPYHNRRKVSIMSKIPLMPVDEIRKLLWQDRDTGKLFWIERPRSLFQGDGAFKMWNSRFANKEAFGTDGHGALHGRVCGKTYSAHKVAWALHYGEWPTRHISHIDGNRENNKIENLKQLAGLKGTSRDDKWRAYIRDGKVNRHLGYHDTQEQAHAAYLAAEAKLGAE